MRQVLLAVILTISMILLATPVLGDLSFTFDPDSCATLREVIPSSSTVLQFSNDQCGIGREIIQVWVHDKYDTPIAFLGTKMSKGSIETFYLDGLTGGEYVAKLWYYRGIGESGWNGPQEEVRFVVQKNANDELKDGCKPRVLSDCYQGHVWNFDSCGNIDNLVEYCFEEERCVESKCINKANYDAPRKKTFVDIIQGTSPEEEDDDVNPTDKFQGLTSLLIGDAERRALAEELLEPKDDQSDVKVTSTASDEPQEITVVADPESVEPEEVLDEPAAPAIADPVNEAEPLPSVPVAEEKPVEAEIPAVVARVVDEQASGAQVEREVSEQSPLSMPTLSREKSADAPVQATNDVLTTIVADVSNALSANMIFYIIAGIVFVALCIRLALHIDTDPLHYSDHDVQELELDPEIKEHLPKEVLKQEVSIDKLGIPVEGDDRAEDTATSHEEHSSKKHKETSEEKKLLEDVEQSMNKRIDSEIGFSDVDQVMDESDDDGSSVSEEADKAFRETLEQLDEEPAGDMAAEIKRFEQEEAQLLSELNLEADTPKKKKASAKKKTKSAKKASSKKKTAKKKRK